MAALGKPESYPRNPTGIGILDRLWTRSNGKTGHTGRLAKNGTDGAFGGGPDMAAEFARSAGPKTRQWSYVDPTTKVANTLFMSPSEVTVVKQVTGEDTQFTLEAVPIRHVLAATATGRLHKTVTKLKAVVAPPDPRRYGFLLQRWFQVLAVLCAWASFAVLFYFGWNQETTGVLVALILGAFAVLLAAPVAFQHHSEKKKPGTWTLEPKKSTNWFAVMTFFAFATMACCVIAFAITQLPEPKTKVPCKEDNDSSSGSGSQRLKNPFEVHFKCAAPKYSTPSDSEDDSASESKCATVEYYCSDTQDEPCKKPPLWWEGPCSKTYLRPMWAGLACSAVSAPDHRDDTVTVTTLADIQCYSSCSS